MTSLRDKINEISLIELDHLIQNDRIGQNARKNYKNIVKKPMTPIQQEMVNDYINKRPPVKIIDEDGNVIEQKLYTRPEPDFEPELDPEGEEYQLDEKTIDLHYTNTKNKLKEDESKTINKIEEELKIEFEKHYNRHMNPLINELERLNKIRENKIQEYELQKNKIPASQRKLLWNDIKNVEIAISEINYEAKLLENDLNNDFSNVFERKVKEIKADTDNELKLLENDEILDKEKYQIRREKHISNLQKIDLYKNRLKELNTGLNIDDKQPYETNEQYQQRLLDIAKTDYPEYMLQDASSSINKEFKKNLGELIKKPSDVETIFNSIEPLGKADKKQVLLKQWSIIKSKFLEVYGENNKYITPDDVIEFFNLFYKENAEGIPKMIYDVIQSDKIKSSSSVIKGKLSYVIDKTHNQIIITNNETKKKLYFRIIDILPHPILVYSFSGDNGSFTEFLNYDRYQPKNKKDEDFDRKPKPTGSKRSSTSIFDETGIKQDDIQLLFSDIPINKIGVINESKFIEWLLKQGVTLISQTNPNITRASYSASKVDYTKYGMGNENLDKIAQLGDVFIMLKKLYYENILSVLNKHHNQYQGFKTVKISEKLVNIIMNLLKNIHPTNSDLLTLSEKERQIYDRLINIANLHKFVINNKENSVDKMKKRMKLIEAEINIGNDNPELIAELENILFSLKDLKVISLKQAKEYIKQFK